MLAILNVYEAAKFVTERIRKAINTHVPLKEINVIKSNKIKDHPGIRKMLNRRDRWKRKLLRSSGENSGGWKNKLKHINLSIKKSIRKMNISN